MSHTNRTTSATTIRRVVLGLGVLAMLASSLLITGAPLVGPQNAAALDAPEISGASDTSPPGFLSDTGEAPNYGAVTAPCTTTTYFPPFPDNIAPAADNVADAVGYTDSVNATPGDPASLTFNMELTAVGGTDPRYPNFSQGEETKGYEMADGDTVEVFFDRPVWYPQFIFVDVDRADEGFTVTPQAGPEVMGVYSGDAPDFVASGNNTSVFFNTVNDFSNDSAWELASRVQVDIFGSLDANDRIEFERISPSSGQSGFAAGGGCEPLGIAKEATAPVWNQADQRYELTYTVRINNNLPDQARLDAYLAQVIGGTCTAVDDGDHCVLTDAVNAIPLGDLVVSDVLDATGFSDVVVNNIVEVADADGINLGGAVNPAFGLADPNITAAGAALPAGTTATIEIETFYYPDHSTDCGAIDITNQAEATAVADGLNISDLSDNGADAAPPADNGEGGLNDPTPVSFPAIDCDINLLKSTTTPTPTINATGSIDVDYDFTVSNDTSTVDVFAQVIDDPEATFGAGAVVSNVVISATGPCAGNENTAWGPGSTNLLLPIDGVLLDAGLDESCEINLSFTVIPPGGAIAGTAYPNIANATGLPVIYEDPDGDGVPDVVGPDTDNPLPAPAEAVVTPEEPAAVPGIELIKSIDSVTDTSGDGLIGPGDTINYTFTVNNTGNVDLTNVTVTDPLVTVVGGPIATLAVAGSDTTTFTATYVITAADLVAGGVENTAETEGTPPAGPAVTDTSDTGTTPDTAADIADIADPGGTETDNPLDVNPNDDADPTEDPTTLLLTPEPGIELIKSIGSVTDTVADGIVGAGDTINYTFTVVNTGNVDLTNVTVTDPLVTVVGGPIPSLLVGGSDTTTFTATYVITAADVLAGGVENTAETEGTPPTGPAVTDTSDTGTTPDEAADITDIADPGGTETDNPLDVNPNDDADPTEDPTTLILVPIAPAIELIKSIDSVTDTVADGFVGVGDTINYTFTVTNTGDVPLTNVTVTDPLVTVVGGPIATLAVGGSDTTTFTATYVITAADLVAGGVENTAGTEGTPPTGPAVTDTSDTGTTPDEAADITDIADPGGTETDNPLDVNPNDDADPTEDPTTLILVSEPSISLIKSIDSVADTSGDGAVGVGDTINYTFTVSNTGNVDLTAVTVSDPLVTVVGGPIPTLAVGASDTTTFTATYVITAADLVAGGVENTADTEGTPPAGPAVTDTSDTGTTPDEAADITDIVDPEGTETDNPLDVNPNDDADPTEDPTTLLLVPDPSISLIKSVASVDDTSGDGAVGAGDTINYTFTVSNTGDVALTNVTVTDPLVTVVGGPVATLAVGASDTTTFTATYVITAADLVAGGVENTAGTEGTPPTGPAVTDTSDTGTTPDAPADITDIPDPEGTETDNPLDVNPNDDADPTEDPTTVLLASDPAISLIKSISSVDDTVADGAVGVGDTINYAFEVCNDGNVPLTAVTVSDPLVTVAGGPIATLAVNACDDTTFTATYVITAQDILDGGVENTATTEGTPPIGDPVTDVSDTGTTPDEAADIADIADPEATETDNPLGENPNDDTDPTEDPTTLILAPAPAISLIKSITSVDDTVADGAVGVGDTINYAFEVCNDGNVPLTAITVTDPLVTVVGGPLASLAVDACDTTTFTATYVITAQDIIDGGVENTATTEGTPPVGDPVTDVSDTGTTPDEAADIADVPDPEGTETDSPLGENPNDGTDPTEDPTTLILVPAPSISLIKSISSVDDTVADGAVGAGDTINYTFEVCNTGDVPLTAVTVSDPLVTVVGGPLASLAVDACDTTTFTATYVITGQDIIDGGVENTATTEGTPPTGDPVTDVSDTGTTPDEADDITDVPDPEGTETDSPLGENPNDDTDPTEDPTTLILAPDPSITLIKSVSSVDDTVADGAAGAGDTINYAFEVCNDGNVPLTGVTVTDPLVTVTGGPIASLAVGDCDDTTFTATYVITGQDIVDGGVENTATTEGTPPVGDPVTDVSDTGTTPDAPDDITDIADPEGTETDSPLGENPNDDTDPTEDPTTVLLASDPAISLIKSITSVDDTVADGLVSTGDTINYTFEVCNDGNVPLTAVTVTDPLVTVTGGPIASLAVGDCDDTTFTATYVITGQDILDGGVENTATTEGTPPVGDPVTDVSDTGTTPDEAADITDVPDPEGTETDSPLGENPNDAADPTEDPTTLILAPAPSISLIKSISSVDDTVADGIVSTGDTINYTFIVTNTGNVPLTDVFVTDPLVTVAGAPISLAVGASDTTTFTATYVITEDDLINGGVENTATTTGTPPDGPQVTDVSDTGTTPEVPEAIADVPDPEGTETDSPLGENPNDPADPTEDPTTVILAPTPAISLIKSIDSITDTVADGETGIGDTINYVFEVCNTGDVRLDQITLTDSITTVVGGPIATLAVGDCDDTTFTATYVITGADVIAGGVENTATTTGNPPVGDPVSDVSDTGTDPTLAEVADPEGTETENPLGENPNDDTDPTEDPTTALLTPAPAISLIKSIDSITDTVADGDTSIGDTINYVFEVCNTGNVPLTNVTLADTITTVVGGPIATLGVGDCDDTTFTATYVITGDDILAGGVENTATTTGTPPNGPDVTDISDTGTDPTLAEVPDPEGTETDNPLDEFPNDDADPTEDPTTVLLDPNPQIRLVKAISSVDDTVADGITSIGDTINYSFEVCNAGNVPLTGITLVDTITTVAGGPIASLGVGDCDDTTFTATYVITAQDIIDGGVENTATTTGDDPDGNPVTDVSDTGTDPDAAPVDDPELTETDNPLDEFPNDDTDPTEDPTTLLIPPNPEITLIKSISSIDDTVADGITSIGDTINYTFIVTNTGDVPLTAVTVTDTVATVVGGPVDLAVGASDTTTFTATYVITAQDLLDGGVENTATATGTPPDGPQVTDVSDTGTDPSGDPVPDPEGTETDNPLDEFPNDDTDPTEDPTTFLLTPTPEISLIKSISSVDDTVADGVPGIGDTINYTFIVTNTGDVPLTDVTISDTIATVVGGPIDLAVGASDTTTFTATYVITAQDILDGGVENTATATGNDPDGNPVTDISDTGTAPDGTDVPDPEGTETPNPLEENPNDDTDPTEDPTTFLLTPDPAINLIKSISSIDDTVADGFTSIGDTINYTFIVTNTGNVPLTDVTISDTIATVVGGPISLAIGESDSTTFTATYVITAQDILDGGVENTATATGNDPDGNPVTDISDTGTDPDGADVDDPENTETDNPLEENPNDDTDPTEDPTTLLLTPAPAINLIKSISSIDDTVADGFTSIGDTINYTFIVTNTGNVPLTDVTISDTIATVVGGPISLAVGASDSTTFTATYVITAQDILDGGVENTATATGNDPDGNPVTDISDTGTDPDGADVDDPENTETDNPLEENPNDDTDPTEDPTTLLLTPAPAINLIKSVSSVADANANGFIDAGDIITYDFVVTNTGNVPLTDVTVTDTVATMAGGPIDLAVGESDSTTFTATYTITDADVIAGGVENTATATGNDPDGNPVSDISDTGTDPDGADVDDPEDTETDNPLDEFPNDDTDPTDDPTTFSLSPQPSVILIKTVASVTDANGDGIRNEGDIVNYVYEIINTGNVPLTDVTITDNDVDVLIGDPVPVLPVGGNDTTSYTATEVITVADVIFGGVEGTATVTGTAANGDTATDISDAGSDPQVNPVDDPAGTETPNPLGVGVNNPLLPGDDPVTVLLTTNPEINLIKSIDSVTDDGDDILGVGDTLNYIFIVTNTGDVPLLNVTVTDPLVTVSGGPIDLPLGASDATTFTATYVLTEADLEAGGVENVATATGQDVTGKEATDPSDAGTDPDGEPIDNPGEEETPNPLEENPNDSDNPGDDPTTFLLPSADLAIDKAVSDAAPDRGDTIDYTVVLTNLGPDAAADPTIVDVLPAGLTVDTLPDVDGWDCSASAGQTIECSAATIAADDEVTFTYSVTVDADAARGSDLTNTVTASSTTRDPNPDNNTDTETVNIPVPPVVTSTTGTPPLAGPGTITNPPPSPVTPIPQPQPPLALTGTNPQVLLAAAAALVLIGGNLAIFGRRRRQYDEDDDF